MQYYDYETFKHDTRALAEKIASLNPDALLPIARGGLTLAHAIAHALDIRAVLPINAILYEKEHKGDVCTLFNLPDLTDYERIVILDDIVDSGETLQSVLTCLTPQYTTKTFYSAALFYKRSAVIAPDLYQHETTQWIDFFWERDFILN